jgi:DNA ligase (NAD+)
VSAGPHTLCPNRLSCPAQTAAELTHLASRAALNIEGIGSSTAQKLIRSGLVSTPSDLFDLRVEQIANLEGFANKRAEKLIAAIARASHVPLHRFLFALGIPGVGSEGARKLAKHFKKMDALLGASKDELTEVAGVGPRVAAQIANYLCTPSNLQVIDSLLDGRVWIEDEGRPSATELEGLRIVFTGSLSRLTRAEAERLVEEHGARGTSSVSGKTDYLVVGEHPGSKYAAAQEQNVEILDEGQFWNLLRERGVVQSEFSPSSVL